jgi:putative ABC transport system permease protein
MKQIFVRFDFVKTLGLELAAGRDFIPDRRRTDLTAFLLNETAVQRLGWGSAEEAIGQRLTVSLSSNNPPFTAPVIGVIRDFHLESLRQPIEPVVFKLGGGGTFAVRTEPNQLIAGVEALKEVWEKVNPGYPLLYSLMDEDIDRLYRAEERLGQVFGVFALIALIIAGIGLFGLISYTTARRTKEIGIRKVLGASTANILRLLSKDFAVLIGLAILIAWPIAYLTMQRWLQTFVYRIDLPWLAFITSSTIAITIAMMAISYHTLRAARANPVKSLRYE